MSVLVTCAHLLPLPNIKAYCCCILLLIIIITHLLYLLRLVPQVVAAGAFKMQVSLNSHTWYFNAHYHTPYYTLYCTSHGTLSWCLHKCTCLSILTAGTYYYSWLLLFICFAYRLWFLWVIISTSCENNQYQLWESRELLLFICFAYRLWFPYDAKCLSIPTPGTLPHFASHFTWQVPRWNNRVRTTPNNPVPHPKLRPCPRRNTRYSAARASALGQFHHAFGSMWVCGCVGVWEGGRGAGRARAKCDEGGWPHGCFMFAFKMIISNYIYVYINEFIK